MSHHKPVSAMSAYRSTILAAFFLTLVVVAAPAAAEGDGTVFTDRFAAGIQQALVDDEHAWWRRGGEIRVGVPCDQGVEVQVVASPGGDWVFEFDGLPDDVTEIGNGRLAVELGCGASDAVVGVSAVSDALEVSDGVVLVLAALDGPPEPPTLEGVDLAGDGLPDIIHDVGVLSPDLEWVKDFPLTAQLIGSADSYTASLGSFSGNEWSLSASESGPYTLTAHRDSLTDEGTGTLDLREARVTHLGDSSVQEVGSELVVSKALPCGEEYTGAFLTNTGDLVPSISASYAAASSLPAGSSLTPEGTFTYTPSCSAGSPHNVIFAVDSEIGSQGNHKPLEQVLVDIDITGVEPGGPGPTVDGLIGADGSIDYFVQDDNGTLFIPPIEYMCGRTRQLEIVGDADSYELVNPPADMSIQYIDDKPTIVYEPDWSLEGCGDRPNGNVSQLILRAHKNGQVLDIDKTAYAMDPRIDCVTHYPGIPAGGGPQPDPVEYCDTTGNNNINGIIELSYNIETPHNIQIHARPSLENYTPAIGYSHSGQNFPSFMGLDSITGSINANPNSGQAGPYSIAVKASNGGKETPWTGMNINVIE